MANFFYAFIIVLNQGVVDHNSYNSLVKHTTTERKWPCTVQHVNFFHNFPKLSFSCDIFIIVKVCHVGYGTVLYLAVLFVNLIFGKVLGKTIKYLSPIKNMAIW